MTNAKSNEMDGRPVSDDNLENIAGGYPSARFGGRVGNKKETNDQPKPDAGATKEVDETNRALHPEKYAGGGINLFPYE